jgi:thiol-disulfide isomerase/thioredoxin
MQTELSGVSSIKLYMKNLFVLLLSLVSLSALSQETIKNTPRHASHHKYLLKVVNFDQLQTILKKNDDKLYVVNFWATWCKPCVAELPGFMAVNNSYRFNPQFKMILVNMDNAMEIDSRVKPFIAKNDIQADVYILDDNKRMNEWIPAVDQNWSGAIPATVIYRNGKKLTFKESEMNKKELVQLIKNYL